MSSQSMLTKLREENTLMSALLKHSQGEPLNAAERDALAEVAKARALEDRLREKHDLGGAIAKALRNPKTISAQAVPLDINALAQDLTKAKTKRTNPAVERNREQRRSHFHGR